MFYCFSIAAMPSKKKPKTKGEIKEQKQIAERLSNGKRVLCRIFFTKLPIIRKIRENYNGFLFVCIYIITIY